MITWSFVEPLLDEMSIGQFEESYGITFPEAYKEIVLRYNGGYPSHNCFILPSGEDCRFNHLYSFNQEDSENMWRFNAGENTDAGLIAFADDSFGNQIAFRIADMAIVFIDYDVDEVTEIAGDFDAFLAQLTED